MTNTIPTIDIEALWSTDAAARRRVASDVGRACRDIGFFVLRGHGVPDGLIDLTFAASRELFALPDEAKQSLAVGPQGHHRGYVGPVKGALKEKTGPDIKEAFSLIWTDETTRPPNVWPPIAGWREAVQSYLDSLLRVGHALHRAFALDLGLEEHFFDDKIDRPLATLRMFRYPRRMGRDVDDDPRHTQRRHPHRRRQPHPGRRRRRWPFAGAAPRRSLD
jgi:isopenicillin N synthase-like dioxygenase